MRGSVRRPGRWWDPAPAATLAAGVALALLAVGLVACGGSPASAGAGAEPTATVTAPAESSASGAVAPSSTPTQAPDTMRVSVYFLRPVMSVKGGQAVAEGPYIATAHRWVPETSATAGAALRALLAGPLPRERDIGMRSALPPGSALHGIAINDGIATVDLSLPDGAVGHRTALARIAQVVYTLTQFPTVKGVRFELDGRALDSYEGVSLSGPVRRADFQAVTPPIFVESPAPFDRVTSPLRVSGTADVFEATFAARLTSGSGARLAHRIVTASSGSGTRGTFGFSLTFATGAPTVSLSVWEVSMEDGSTLHEATIPLTLGS